MSKKSKVSLGREEVPSVTDASEDLATAQSRRMRNYAIKMGLRVVFLFVAAASEVFSLVFWLALGLAVVLPYIAVIDSTVTARKKPGQNNPVEPLHLEAGETEAVEDNSQVIKIVPEASNDQ